MPLAWPRFGLFRFRSPLLPESSFLSLPPGTEMFHFPGFASAALCIQAGIAGFSTRLGFPIRTPPDRSLVGGSPRLFAATRVLHRLLAPRHPSHALCSLQTSNFSPPPTARQIRRFERFAKLAPPFAGSALFLLRRLTRLLSPAPARLPLARAQATKTLQSKLNSSSYSVFRELRLELTGIEPATSSLQSWRSPS
jgi:hypothetical protein